MAHIFRVTLRISDVRRESPGWSVDHHFPHPICEPWCWYIYLQNWVILFGQMLVNIPYMEHIGMTIAILRHPPCLDNPMWINWKPCCSFRHVWPYAKKTVPRSEIKDFWWFLNSSFSKALYTFRSVFDNLFTCFIGCLTIAPLVNTHETPIRDFSF